MLSNDERINPNIVPLEKLRAMDEDTYEDVVAAEIESGIYHR